MQKGEEIMLGTIIETAGKALGLVMTSIENEKTLRDNRDRYLRAYQFEVSQNLELLDTIKQDVLKDLKVSSPEFAALIDNLQTEAASFIFFGSSGDLYQLLKQSKTIRNDQDQDLVTGADEQEQPVTRETIEEPILQSIRFTICKIEILKKLVACNKVESSLFQNFRLKQRIFNIKQRLLVINQFLYETLKGKIEP